MTLLSRREFFARSVCTAVAGFALRVPHTEPIRQASPSAVRLSVRARSRREFVAALKVMRSWHPADRALLAAATPTKALADGKQTRRSSKTTVKWRAATSATPSSGQPPKDTGVAQAVTDADGDGELHRTWARRCRRSCDVNGVTSQEASSGPRTSTANSAQRRRPRVSNSSCTTRVLRIR